jgi:alpha/beta superfamily hydrolase
VHGEHDEFGDVEQLRLFVDELKEKAREGSQIQLDVIPGAGHFFDESLDELKRLIRDWIEQQLKKV